VEVVGGCSKKYLSPLSDSSPWPTLFLAPRIAGCGTGTSAAARSRRRVHELISVCVWPEGRGRAVICWWFCAGEETSLGWRIARVRTREGGSHESAEGIIQGK
jgi:hypothetical protein